MVVCQVPLGLGLPPVLGGLGRLLKSRYDVICFCSIPALLSQEPIKVWRSSFVTITEKLWAAA